MGTFSEGLAHVRTEKPRGYVDQTGALVMPLPSGISGTEFHDGVALIYSDEGNLLKMIDMESYLMRCCHLQIR